MSAALFEALLPVYVALTAALAAAGLLNDYAATVQAGLLLLRNPQLLDQERKKGAPGLTGPARPSVSSPDCGLPLRRYL